MADTGAFARVGMAASSLRHLTISLLSLLKSLGLTEIIDHSMLEFNSGTEINSYSGPCSRVSAMWYSSHLQMTCVPLLSLKIGRAHV